MISAVAVTPDSRYIIGGHGTQQDHVGHITFWDFQTGSFIRADKWTHSKLEQILVTPDSHSLTVSGRDDHVYNDGTHYLKTCIIDSKEYKTIRAARDFPLDISLSWDKQHVLFGDYVWDWKKGGEPYLKDGKVTHDGYLHPKVVELTQDQILTSNDETYLVKEVKSNQIMRRLDVGHNNKYHKQTPFKVSADNRYLFAQRGSQETKDEILCMWDIQTGVLIKSFETFKGNGRIHSVDITSDNQFIVAAIGYEPDRAIIVVNVETDEVVLQIEHEQFHVRK